MTHVLITGARGKTGAPLAAQLAATAGVSVAAGTTDPARLVVPGATAVRFDWDDPATYAAAARGAQAVFVVRPDAPWAPERIAALVAAAPGARVVLLSELRPDGYDRPWIDAAERAVTANAERWALVRPSWFMQVFTDERFYLGAVQDGRVPFVAGAAPVSWVDARDIAAVSAAALLDDAHAGAALTPTGPSAVTPEAALEVIAAAAGHPVTLDGRPVADLVAGMDAFDAENTAGALERIASGAFSVVTDDVERATGRPARTFEAFAAEHAPLWRGA